MDICRRKTCPVTLEHGDKASLKMAGKPLDVEQGRNLPVGFQFPLQVGYPSRGSCKFDRKPLVVIFGLRHQLRQSNRLQQACGHASGKCLARAGQDRQAGPEGVTGRGVRVTGQRIQEKIRGPMPGQVLRQCHARGKYQPARIDSTGLRLPA